MIPDASNQPSSPVSYTLPRAQFSEKNARTQNSQWGMLCIALSGTLPKRGQMHVSAHVLQQRLLRQPFSCTMRTTHAAPLQHHADFHEELRKALVFCRINPPGFKSHSLRIGAATTAAALVFQTTEFAS